MPYSDKYRGGGRHNALQNTSGNYDPYGTTIPTREFNGDTTIDTYSSEETRQYLAKRANDVYIDPDAKSTDDNTTERLITREQQVVLRHLQPPTLPPPGPLFIKEWRPPQPPPFPPLVIRQFPSRDPPSLILREKPPETPPHGCGETAIRCLPPVPVPLRSLMEERYPSIPQKSPDIIIEKWLPYPRQPERREIVEHAPDAIKYPEPFHTITNYRKVRTRTHQNFDNHVVDENPRHYKACHGASLLDPEKLVQEAAKAGVTADKLAPPIESTSMRRNISNSDAECYHPSVIINHGSSSSHGTSGNGKQSAYTQTNETASTQTDETASTQTDKKSRSLCGRRSRVD